jgi:serine/threonine-protein kinase
MFDLSGQTFGQYEIIGRIGRGGMAVVYRARQQAVGREVAVKVIQTATPDPNELQQFVMRFECEAKLIACVAPCAGMSVVC